jgi:hypothetical protein
MSNRFHSKHHRFSHHTAPTSNPRWPDAARDPIASHETPFLGDFVMLGTLSAISSSLYSSNSALAGSFEGQVNITSNLSADNISLMGDVIRIPPIVTTSSGKYLVIKLSNEYYGIRLWNLPPSPFIMSSGTSSLTSLTPPPGFFVLSVS